MQPEPEGWAEVAERAAEAAEESHPDLRPSGGSSSRPPRASAAVRTFRGAEAARTQPTESVAAWSRVGRSPARPELKRAPARCPVVYPWPHSPWEPAP